MSCNCFGRYTLWGVALLAPIAPLMGQTDTTLEAHVLPSIFDGSNSTVALDINDRGLIVGWSTNSAEKTRATLWNQQGKPHRLACPEETSDCSAVAINEAGAIVGDATPVDFSKEFAFIVRWSPSGEVRRASTPTGFFEAYASDINDQGFVVGSVRDYEFGGSGPSTATFWRRNGAPTQKLQPITGAILRRSEALAINSNRQSSRQVVGVSAFPSNITVATTWDRQGKATALLGLHGNGSEARGVNRNGTVVGNSVLFEVELDQSISTVSTAVVWASDGQPVALDLLQGCSESSAEDINDAGFVVGSNSACAGRPGDVAVIWNPEGEVFALPLPAKFVASNAVAINSQGDVVGYAVNRNGKTVAIVWR